MSGEVNSTIDLYDHEIPLIEGVLDRLNANVGKVHDNVTEEALRFKGEIEERFAEIGLLVGVMMVPEQVDARIISPHITINGRMEDHEFDHDRQVHEVTNDILGIAPDGGGVIKTKSGLILPGQG